MKLSYLVRGTPGHPVHPPLTDATIGIYTFATAMAVIDVLELAERNGAIAWWLALIVGLIFNAPTSVTGLIDWLQITKGTPLRRTATLHMISMVTAAACFGIAAYTGYDDYKDWAVTTVPFVFTLAGFAFLTAGGWLGGVITYVHGMRVLDLPGEPTARAVSPVPHPEKERADAG